MILDSGTLPLWFLSCGDEGLSRLVISMVLSIFRGPTLLKVFHVVRSSVAIRTIFRESLIQCRLFRNLVKKYFRGLEARNKSVHNVSGSARLPLNS